MNKLQIKAAIQIQKPAEEVFEAIVDPEKMKNYFISGSSGRMEAGKSLMWKFPEFDDEYEVKTGAVEKNKFISFNWQNGDKETLVEISLTPKENNSTLVNVTEGEMEYDEAGINLLKGNTEGWANFLACLKAYLEYGINLRKGAFDFMRK
jgi:uncharacterized protein YndB with AHSA1/START domain